MPGSSSGLSINYFHFIADGGTLAAMKTLIISLGMLCAVAVVAHGQDATKATCKLESKSGSQVTGTVTFTKTGAFTYVDVGNAFLGMQGSVIVAP